MLWLERWQALCSKAAGSYVYPRFEERSSFCDYNGHYGISELCDICPMSQLDLCRASHHMPTAAQIREVADALPEADDLVVAEITHRAAVVSGLAAEQPRHYLQHALNFQVHDERHPHHPRRHGRADTGWKAAPEDD